MPEGRRSRSIEKSHASDVPEKGFHNHSNALAEEMRALELDLLEATAHAKTMSSEEVEETINYLLSEHGKDPFFPPLVIEAAKRYRFDEELKNDPLEYQKIYEELQVEAALLVLNSPYAEVRAVVDNYDDPTIPSSTFRAWLIGTIFVAVGGFINQFFSIRQPGIVVSASVIQLLAFPAGKFLEAVLPTRKFTTFGCMWSLNPGKFNLKEHMVITIMGNVGVNTPYTASIIWVQYLPLYFNQAYASKFGYQILVALSTNFIGYGLAGITRQFLVYPPQAVWPANLATIALNRAFHSQTNSIVNGWTISRMRWFMYCFTAMFIYFWFPNYIVQAMSYFNWITWISPDNIKLSAIAGSVTGLGLNPLPTFDWNQLTAVADPLINPFFSITNVFLGALFTLPVIAAIWFTNTWYTGHLPINSNRLYDNTGTRYQVSRVVNDKSLFDESAYKAYSPAYLSASNSLVYGAFFGVYASTLTHTALYHRREIASAFKNLVTRRPVVARSKDIHTRLMKSYREVPEWVYFLVLCVSIITGAIGIAVYPTNTSPAVVLYGVFLAIIFCVPCGIIMAITNVEVTLNVVAELFGGLWFPGNATAMNYFKAYGYVTTSHTLHFAQDLKLAHYTHIPPWVTFNCQMFATLVSTFVCTAILNYQMTEILDVCTPDQKNNFTCPGVNAFFTSSVLWGTLGPKKMFGPGSIYNGLLWCFPIGALLPIPFYLLGKKWKVFQYFHVPIFLYGGLTWAPYNLSNIWPAFPVAWLFNYYIKKRWLGWWSKYNYITTTAFACAIAISALVMFFALQQQGIEIDWSGNSLPFSGCDGAGCALHPVSQGGHFGPGEGEF